MNGISGSWPPEETATTYVIGAKDWPAVDWPMSIMTNGSADASSWTGEGDWGQFWIGVGGTCVDREPSAGYFCAPHAPRKISTPNHPVGVRPTSAQLPNLPYLNATGAVVHAWRPGHWYTNMYEVGGASSNTAGAELNFSRGGFQGGEGVTGGEAWYIENVIEELDVGREWYFDHVARKLFYMPNSTAGQPPPSSGFVSTGLDVLINATGSQSVPVKGLTIQGLTLRDTSATYLAPHGLPSGGDWALQRTGAITLVGTEGLTVSSNLLTELDGNAIFIGGYHRGLTIEGNEFYGIGDSVLAAWGDTSECLNANCSMSLPKGFKMGPDGRGGDQPHGTLVRGNLAVARVGLEPTWPCP